jgi:hypothetical protein
VSDDQNLVSNLSVQIESEPIMSCDKTIVYGLQFTVNFMRMTVERACLTFGLGLTEVFANSNDEGVVLVEELGVLGQVGLKEVLEFMVVEWRLDQAVTCGHSGAVGVDHEDGAI